LKTIIIDIEKCNRCGLCAKVCSGSIRQAGKKSLPVVTNSEDCIACGHCVAVCRMEAIWLGHVDMQNFPLIGPELPFAQGEVLRFLRKRRSIRNYQKRPVPRLIMERILEARSYVPSGCNAQALDYVVVQQPERLMTVARLCIGVHREDVARLQDKVYLASLDSAEQEIATREAEDSMVVIEKCDSDPAALFFHAPSVIVIHAKRNAPTTPVEDAALASFAIMLMAESLGLGTCFIGDFYGKANHDPAIKEMLAIAPENEILIAFSCGYPAVRYQRLVDRRQPEIAWK
jgi:nitroreductase/NAD-dependent dihydropyrimidine dehydrogenase PreA subunit